jgi:hypothetical protein
VKLVTDAVSIDMSQGELESAVERSRAGRDVIIRFEKQPYRLLPKAAPLDTP